jgi:hypothetical protein
MDVGMKDIMDALDCLMSDIADVVGVDFFQTMDEGVFYCRGCFLARIDGNLVVLRQKGFRACEPFLDL